METNTQLQVLKDNLVKYTEKFGSKPTKAQKKQLKFIKDKIASLEPLKGVIVTKSDLTEYKGLIIFMLRKCNFKGYLDIKSAMVDMLTEVQSENVFCKTKRSIKSTIVRLAIEKGLQNCYNNMIEKEGIDILTDNTYNNKMLKDFQMFSLNAKM